MPTRKQTPRKTASKAGKTRRTTPRTAPTDNAAPEPLASADLAATVVQRTATAKRARTWVRPFLRALRTSGNVTVAAMAANINRATAYKLRYRRAAFAQLWDEALAEANDLIEAEALRRGVQGVKEPIYQGGQLIGYVNRYSDTLLLALLKATKPEKYGDKLTVRLTREQQNKIEQLGFESASEAFNEFLMAMAEDDDGSVSGH